jgi:hypothetical protein
MEAQSKTLLGMWSNVKDKLTFTLVAIGDALIPWAKSFVNESLDPMLSRVKALAEGFGKLPKPLQDLTLGAAGAAVAFPLLAVAIGATITNTIVIAGAIGKLGPLLTSLSLFISGQLLGTLAATATWFGTLSVAAASLATGGLLALAYAVYKVADAWSLLKSAQEDEGEQEGQRQAALTKLENTMRQQGINIDSLRKQYDAGKLGLDAYVRALSDLERQHVKVNGSSKDAMDTQAALDALNLKSTATRKKELEIAKEAYEALKKAGEGQQVLAEAALKVKQAEDALNGTLDSTKDKYVHLSTAVKDYKDSLSEMLATERRSQGDTSVKAFVGAIAEADRFSSKLTTVQGFLQKLKDQFSALGNGPAPNMMFGGISAAELDKASKATEQITTEVDRLAARTQSISPFGVLAESAQYFGITTADQFDEVARKSQEMYDKMLKSGKATERDLAQAALMTAQAKIDADLSSGRISAEQHAARSKEIKDELAMYTGAIKKKATLLEQIASETNRISDSMFRSMERGLASDIVHWKGFSQTIKNVFQTLGEDILTIMFHAFLKPVEKLFADVLAGIAEKLLGVFITQKIASTTVSAGQVASDAAVGGAAAAASIAAIPIIGPALAIEAGVAMYGAILGTFMPLVLAGAAAKGGFGDVPRDMSVLLHQKEMVLPADIAVPLRAQLRGGGGVGGGLQIHIGTMHGVARETVDLLAGQIVRQARLAGARI